MLNDRLALDYSVIILDEAHERSQDFDIILGLLSKAIKIRRRRFEEQLNSIVNKHQFDIKQTNYIDVSEYNEINISPLKLVLMSATPDEDAFSQKLFGTKPHILRLQRKTFPIAIHFERNVCTDYVRAAVDKAV